jgi:hypothetical protein
MAFCKEQRVFPDPVAGGDEKRKDHAMKNLGLTEEELSLIRMLLRKEEVSTRVEEHHARGVFEYSEYLRDREKKISALLNRVKDLMEEER